LVTDTTVSVFSRQTEDSHLFWKMVLNQKNL
jgi:hypothetical protein